MRIISFPEKEIEDIKERLKEKDTLYTVRVSSEYGQYKKGDYVKSSWGERFVVIDLIQIKGFDHFMKECVHYEDLRNADIKEIERVANYKKIEIIELKKVDNKKAH